MNKLAKWLDLGYKQTKWLNDISAFYVVIGLNILGIFSTIYLFIILKNILRWLLGYNFN